MAKSHKQRGIKYAKIHRYKWSGDYDVRIEIDHQTFFVRTGGSRTKEEAVWYREMAAIALGKMIRNELATNRTRNPPKHSRKRVSR